MSLEPSPKRVVSLTEAVGLACGGKAGALAELARSGFTVPDAVVLLPAALEGWSAWEAEGTFAEKAARIKTEPFPSELLEELMQAVEGLGAPRVAVRSSGLDEDGAEQSFAGQHHTSLDVEVSPEPILEAVRACWASAFSAHAEVYRGAVGADKTHVKMAVLIQRMVHPTCAGVAFTLDPVDGRDQVVVEAVEGLGEALVSGRRMPDRFCVSREGQLLASTRATLPSGLTETQALEVARLALRVEQHKGQPQDIEWAIDETGLFLLQARPITVVMEDAAEPPDQHVRVWASTNARELFPRPATPMTASALDAVLKGFFGPTFRMLGIDLEKVPLAGVVGGRIYMCLNTFIVFFRIVPGMNRRTPAEVFGGDADAARRALEAIPNPDPLVPPPSVFAIFGGLLRLFRVALLSGKDAGRRALDAARADNAALLQFDERHLSEAQLRQRLQQALQFNEMWTRTGHAVVPGLIAFEAANHLATHWLGPADANLLFSGMGEVDSAQSARDLLDLAGQARRAGLHGREPAPTLADVRRMQPHTDEPEVEETKAFLHQFDGWMTRHGHHARGEADVAIPRLVEEPESVFRIVLELSQGGEPPSGDRHQAAREALLQALPKRLGFLRARLLGWLVARGRAGISFRENMKSELIRRVGVIRRVLNALGTRWAGEGRLMEAGDIYFLTLPEVLEPSPGAPWRPRIRARKGTLRQWAGVTTPTVVIGSLTPADCVPEPPSNATRLTGLPVSPGLVEGRARVLLESEAGEVVKAGEILVAPFTDPGWAPHFVLAAGLVVDEGGMLSHGSVVARELGLPAVVNVREGTRAIRSGDLIRLDAIKGEVVILERGERA